MKKEFGAVDNTSYLKTIEGTNQNKKIENSITHLVLN